jgi:hypothetical protein
MKRRDVIIEDLHKLRERIGRAHDFDVDRIAATIRQHERETAIRNRAPVEAEPTRRQRRAQPRSRKAAQRARWSRRRVN